VISSSLARCVIGTALTAFLVAAPIELAAQAPAAPDLSGLTASGSYLAARHAGQDRDAAAAAAYYRAALKYDPKNGDLLDRTFLSLLVGGDIDEAVKYAERIAQADKNDRVAELVLGVAALKHKQYAAARRDLALSIRGPITDLTATLLSAWSMYGAGDSKGAVAAIDRLAGPEWYAIFKELHAGMIYDLAGNKKEAGKRLEHAYKLDATALRVVEAYGSWMSRNASTKEALGIFEAFDKVLPRHPLVVEAMNQLKADEKLPTLVTPKRSTGSAPRSAAAAARISAWSICSFRCTSRPIIRWRCSRSPIFMNHSRSRRWRSRPMSAFRRVRRCIVMPRSRWRPISIRSSARTRPRSTSTL
jgi:tetratricopeptide (TPR) repeat protein